MFRPNARRLNVVKRQCVPSAAVHPVPFFAARPPSVARPARIRVRAMLPRGFLPCRLVVASDEHRKHT